MKTSRVHGFVLPMHVHCYAWYLFGMSCEKPVLKENKCLCASKKRTWSRITCQCMSIPENRHSTRVMGSVQRREERRAEKKNNKGRESTWCSGTKSSTKNKAMSFTISYFCLLGTHKWSLCCWTRLSFLCQRRCEKLLSVLWQKGKYRVTFY